MESIWSTVLDSVSWVTALLAIVVCIVFYFYIQWAHMPPGPIGLPYLGYYPFLRSDYHRQLHNMVKKYGDVFCLRCTGQLYVYLGSLQAIREAYITKSDCFTDKSENFSLIQDTFADGVAFENGEKWSVLRTFFAQYLKEFGMGERIRKNLMGDFLQETVDTMRKKEGENFNALNFFTETCTRAAQHLLLSGTKVDDDDIRTINEAYSVMKKSIVGKNGLLAGPLLKFMMLYLKPELRRYQKCKFRMESILSKIICEHEKDFDKDNIRDLIDCYINERKVMEEKGDGKSKIFSEKALLKTLMQCVGDGGCGAGVLVALVLKQLINRPEVQKEIRREMNDAVGSDRFPSWYDRNRMPYTNAVIYECMRTCDFFPTFPSLECSEETTVSDCRIPKGAITLVSFSAALNDPDVYKEPEMFDPKRFMLNEDQEPRSELPIIFGVGERSCIGGRLVIMQTFLFVTTVLQNFDLSPAEGDAMETPSKEKDNTGYNILLRATSRAS